MLDTVLNSCLELGSFSNSEPVCSKENGVHGKPTQYKSTWHASRIAQQAKSITVWWKHGRNKHLVITLALFFSQRTFFLNMSMPILNSSQTTTDSPKKEKTTDSPQETQPLPSGCVQLVQFLRKNLRADGLISLAVLMRARMCMR